MHAYRSPPPPPESPPSGDEDEAFARTARTIAVALVAWCSLRLAIAVWRRELDQEAVLAALVIAACALGPLGLLSDVRRRLQNFFRRRRAG